MWMYMKQEEDMSYKFLWKSYRFLWKTGSGSGQNGQCYILLINKFMGIRNTEVGGYSTRENSELKITWMSQFIVCIHLNSPTWFDKCYLLELNFAPNLQVFCTLLQHPSVPQQHYLLLSSVRSDCQLQQLQALFSEFFPLFSTEQWNTMRKTITSRNMEWK